jgi:putative copper resistance protein D
MTAAAIWIGGLPCLAAVLFRAPRTLPGGGRKLASATLARFSRIALWLVAIIVVTGIVRLAGELSSPAQLWSTAYGRSIVLKAALLCPVLLLATRHRRLIGALAGAVAPTAARLRAVGRTVQMELAIAAVIIAVAAVLVAQVPGRT